MIGIPLKPGAALPIALALSLAGCGAPRTPTSNEAAPKGADHGEEGVVTLTPQQIAAAGIELVSPTIGGSAGAIELPATIEGDPQATQVVSASIGGRVVSLTRNLGQSVGRGETLAVIESREAAQLKGEIEATEARLALAESNYARERRLFAERVSPEQDLIAARTAATEARIALRLARQQLSAAGAGGGGLNRIGIPAPIAGQVIARSATLGQTVAADAELYRIADLDNVSLSLALQPADAGRLRPGTAVIVIAPGRQASARITFVSPALDPDTRLVTALAQLDNRAGQWRVGEPVTASIQLGGGGDGTIRVPTTAVQTIEGRTVVFVRTGQGFRAAPVALGRQDGDMVVVTKGLTGRERIAAQNSFTLKSALGTAEAGHED
ncbi:efflux RND transporter periplasmic adaptor subunit [Sphingomonas cannabina]|uniref:efflux RND transporter periplasmic adaptor subunit n=1 Tax=Sphingomonas cannabina TaxID=2899123 RepID=UPI001F410823|nr:efflux RND transporter periplasmic adaptor subunit [Sphingomonas cannabina]UIJ43516.1 efflux RND transporter periplasmic adaptor subunit [Sphingomonas cannabina]